MPTSQQYIYTIRPTRLAMLTEGANENEAQALSGHGAYLQGLAEKGIIFLAGRTQTADPDTFGIVIINLEEEEEARQIMENDPAVKHGVMQAKLYPYRIAILSQKP